MYARDRFRLTGRIAEHKLTSDNGNEVTRAFCPACGSPIFGANSGMRDHVTITLGTLDDSSTFAPQVTVFTRNRKPWDVMDDRIPSFPAQPGWQPGDPVWPRRLGGAA